MIPLTIHLLVGDNEDTILQTLESILPLQASVIVVDTGCNDNTIDLVKSYGVSVIRAQHADRSVIRNRIVEASKTDWQFYIEPWEVLLYGHEKFADLIEGNSQSYYCELLQNDIITKQVRIWCKNALRFTNPVFEILKDENAAYADIMLCLDKVVLNEEKVEKWRQENPFAAEPYYFQSCVCLAQKKYKEFLSNAEYYLFNEKQQTISTIMTRYYMSIVYCLVTNDLEAAIRNALMCVAEHPLMAEFWCLLGDAYFQAKEFYKSMAFYENAMLLGQRRLRSDRWPMHISKYDDYPKEMISICQDIIKKIVKI